MIRLPLLPLLPLLFLLSPGFGKASAQETRPNNMVTVSKGDNALLPCALSSGQNIDRFDWRKDNGEEEKEEVFMYNRGLYYGQGLPGQNEQFIGRVEFFKDELKSGNASIKIKNTRLEDNGTYTCFVMTPVTSVVNIILNVVGVLKIRENVTGAAPLPYTYHYHFENGRILLECKAQGVPKPEVEWRDSSGEALTAENNVLEYKDASGRFHVEVQVNVTKTDHYTCVVTQRSIYHQISSTLENIAQGAAPEPYIDTIVDKGTWRLLECKTKGVPKPEVEWRNSAGKVLEKDVPKNQSGPSDVKLQLKVTKSDTYTCLVTQKSIYHQTNKTIEVALPGMSTLWIVIITASVVIVIVCVGHVLVQRLRRKF